VAEIVKQRERCRGRAAATFPSRRADAQARVRRRAPRVPTRGPAAGESVRAGTVRLPPSEGRHGDTFSPRCAIARALGCRCARVQRGAGKRGAILASSFPHRDRPRPSGRHADGHRYPTHANRAPTAQSAMLRAAQPALADAVRHMVSCWSIRRVIYAHPTSPRWYPLPASSPRWLEPATVRKVMSSAATSTRRLPQWKSFLKDLPDSGRRRSADARRSALHRSKRVEPLSRACILASGMITRPSPCSPVRLHPLDEAVDDLVNSAYSARGKTITSAMRFRNSGRKLRFTPRAPGSYMPDVTASSASWKRRWPCAGRRCRVRRHDDHVA